jgi:sulfatase maturation enzyme AslB (radical SAM superfamily)
MGAESEFNPQTKLFWHARSIAAFLGGNQAEPPVSVEIAPTNHCTAKCPWCFYVASDYKQRHSREELDQQVLAESLRDMANMGVRAIAWTGGGDPAVYSAIDDMIDLAATIGLQQGMFTNAYRPIRSPEKLAWIRVTVTEQFRLSKHVREYAQATKTGVNYNLCEENEAYLKPLVEAARSAGVAYFQVRPALADRWDLQQLVETPHWLKEYATPQFRVLLTPYKFDDYARPHGYPLCHGHRLTPFVWHNGDVAVCAYHFGREDYTFGNLHVQRFPSIWLGERRRRMLNQGIAVIPQCQHACKLHEVNKVLSALRGEGAKPDNLDFI